MDWYIPETLRNFRDENTQIKAIEIYNMLKGKRGYGVDNIRLTNKILLDNGYNVARISKEEIERKKKLEAEAKRLAIQAALNAPLPSYEAPVPEQPSLGFGGIWD